MESEYVRHTPFCIPTCSQNGKTGSEYIFRKCTLTLAEPLGPGLRGNDGLYG